MMALSATPHLDRAFFLTLADWFTVGVALALPWSTSLTGIFTALWLAVALATINPAALKRELLTAAGGLPVLLWCLGAVGMLWADVSWTERLGGLDGFDRLLVIPLLLTHFRCSRYGGWAVSGFLISSAVVLLVSFVLVLTPGLTWRGHVNGVPVHDDIFQGTEFLICGFGALGYSILKGRGLDRRILSMLFLIGALFLANFAFVTISRAAVLAVPILAVLLGWRIHRWQGIFGAAILAAAIASVGMFFSPSLRNRANQSIEEVQAYRATNAATSVGQHLAFLKESAVIVASAPVIGHGTGSIPEEFRRIAVGKTGVSGEATVNPHDQTFAVAIQLGVVGALVLWAMWIAHLLLFGKKTVVAWLGMVVVIENIVSSVFHTHLFDFNNGWLYVFGVGVLGGTVLRQRDADSINSAAPT
jgi:O-antigen ligase